MINHEEYETGDVDRVTVTLPAELMREIDRREENCRKFKAPGKSYALIGHLRSVDKRRVRSVLGAPAVAK